MRCTYLSHWAKPVRRFTREMRVGVFRSSAEVFPRVQMHCTQAALCETLGDHLLAASYLMLRFMPNLAPVLLAESDANDVVLLRRAFEKVRISNPLIVVQDGRQAIEYLGRHGRYKDSLEYPWPCLMLLALKLRLMDGTEVLSWWKEHDHPGELPIIVLTSSASPHKIEQIMSLGATDYRFRPRDFEGLIDLAQELRFGWVERHALSANGA